VSTLFTDNQVLLDETLFADNQVLLDENEIELQHSLYSLNIIIRYYNVQIYTKKLELWHSLKNNL
jgi:hypothetical protein